MIVVLVVLAVLILIFAFPPLRRILVTSWVMPIVGGALPRMGDTERIALEAGSVWWDAELFSGRPAWKKLLGFHAKPLTEAERAFLAGPVETLCGMVDEWDVLARRDLSPEA